MTVAVRSFTMQSPTFGNEREAGGDVEGRPFVVLPGPHVSLPLVCRLTWLHTGSRYLLDVLPSSLGTAIVGRPPW